MQNQALMYEYLNWATVIFTVIGLFNHYSKKHKSVMKLLLLTILPAWLVATFMRVIICIATGAPALLSIMDFPFHLAGTLVMVVIFGGITFFFKYRKFKKTGLMPYEKSGNEADISMRIKQRQEYNSLIDEIGKNEEK